MATLREAVNAAVTASFCTLSAPLERTLQLGEDWYDNADLPGFTSGPTPAGEGLRAARNLLCNEVPDPVGSEIAPPFTGGQCDDLLYNGTGRPQFPPDPPLAFSPFSNRPGPISLIRDNSDTQLITRLVDGNGASLISAATTPGNEQPQIVEISVTPVGGVPDVCGNPPDETPTYNPNDFTETVDVTYTDNDGLDLTIPVGLVFAPVKVDVNGELTVPVDVTFNTGISLNGELNLDTGDFNFIQDIDVTLPTPVTDPTVLTDPNGVPGDNPTSQEEIERAIIGVYVRVISAVPPFPGTPRPTNNPGTQFFVPRLGSVSFHCEILSAAGLGWTEDIDVKYSSQVVYCPVPWGAKDVRVTPQPGVAMEVTIIRGESERDLALRAAGVL